MKKCKCYSIKVFTIMLLSIFITIPLVAGEVKEELCHKGHSDYIKLELVIPKYDTEEKIFIDDLIVLQDNGEIVESKRIPSYTLDVSTLKDNDPILCVNIPKLTYAKIMKGYYSSSDIFKNGVATMQIQPLFYYSKAGQDMKKQVRGISLPATFKKNKEGIYSAVLTKKDIVKSCPYLFELNDGEYVSFAIVIVSYGEALEDSYSNYFALHLKNDTNKVVVSFDTRGGSKKESIELPIYDTQGKPDYRIGPSILDYPTKQGYTFIGWSSEENDGFVIHNVEPDVEVYTENTVLYANWIDSSIIKLNPQISWKSILGSSKETTSTKLDMLHGVIPKGVDTENSAQVLKYLDKDKDGYITNKDYTSIFKVNLEEYFKNK